MKKGGGKRKGSSFEREICKQLSIWWAGHDDIFWRTSSSGGRATTRHKGGNRCTNQYGDIAAVDPCGAALIDLVTIELKAGYNKVSLFDIMDKPDHTKAQQWEAWIEQARESHEIAGSFAWMILARRDKRSPIVVMPQTLLRGLRTVDALQDTPSPFMTLALGDNGDKAIVCCMRLEDFLKGVTPKQIKELSRQV